MAKNNKNISSKEYIAYLSGSMKPDSKASFEDEISNEEFEKEALEGFQSIPSNEAVQAISDITKNIEDKVDFKDYSKNITFFWRSLAIAASLILFIGLFYFISNMFSSNTQMADNKKASSESSFNDVEVNKSIVYDDANEEVSLMPSIENVEEVEIEEATAVKDEIAEIERENNQTVVEEDIDIETIANAANTLKDEVEAKEINVEGEEEIVDAWSEEQVSYFDKTNSQRASEPSSIKINTAELASNKSKESVETVNPYFYSQAMELYKQKKYPTAIEKFEESINNGENVNSSNYYIGMSYYNLGRLNKSIKYLDIIANNNSSSLKPNAQWYLSLIYLEKNNVQGAKALLNELANGNSGFKNQAIDKLNTL